VVVTAAVCAVVAGYRSYAAIAEWVADVPDATAGALGIAVDRRPSEAMIRRLLQALDPDLLTMVIGAWLASRTLADIPAGRPAIAVDGKTRACALRSSGFRQRRQWAGPPPGRRAGHVPALRRCRRPSC
jgi:hypothetical protein